MARFRGTMTGNRGEVSKLGHADSGLEAEINGWNCGASVLGKVGEEGQDQFDIYATSGSNGTGPNRQFIGTVTDTKNGFKFIPA